MKKALKIIGKVLMWTAIAVVALLLLSPLWIGPVGRIAANVAVPKITGTAFSLGELSVNPYTGTLHVGKMRLENPEGFSDREAVTLDKLDVKVSMASLFTEKILVEEVAISGVYATYVSHDGRNNFDVIAENASGGPKAGDEKKKDAVKADDGILIHLATEEYQHLFDWQRVRQEVRVIQPLFYVRKGNDLKMQAVWAKTCRGAMARFIIEHRINNPEGLCAFNYEGFAYDPKLGEPNYPHYIKQ